jgi:hypothetical protein
VLSRLYEADLSLLQEDGSIRGIAYPGRKPKRSICSSNSLSLNIGVDWTTMGRTRFAWRSLSSSGTGSPTLAAAYATRFFKLLRLQVGASGDKAKPNGMD